MIDINNIINLTLSSDYQISKKEAMELIDVDIFELAEASKQLKEHFWDNGFELCTIINGKSGRCSENCKFCAQSSYFDAKVEEFPLLDTENLLKNAQYNQEKGVLRYSIVTSGRQTTPTELKSLLETYTTINKNSSISLCASHGLLRYDDFIKLKDAGVERYHNNLETSRNFFPKICTSHSYDDKIRTINDAIKAGLSVCSGGILGLGESMEDRIDMFLELRNLGVKSVPINILNPIPGTPFESNPLLSNIEILQAVSILRFIIPDSIIRLAGGRGLLNDNGLELFTYPANAAITGDMLTTTGISIFDDIKMLQSIGYEIKKL